MICCHGHQHSRNVSEKTSNIYPGCKSSPLHVKVHAMERLRNNMKKNKSFYLLIIGILVGIFAFSGCTNHNNSDAKNIQQDTKDPTPEKFSVVESQEPTLTEVDWSNYFEGLTGTAIVYDPTEKNYMIYNKELALTQRSPCSTFKIISSLIGLCIFRLIGVRIPLISA